MKSIFLLHFRQVIRENDWILPLLVLLACALFGDRLAPIQDDPSLGFSARTQAIWGAAWLCSILWVSFVAARLGSMQRAKRLRDFWKSLGLNDFKYFGGLFLIPNVLNAGLFVLAAVLSSICGRMPEAPLSEWILVNLQAVLFAVLAQAIVAAVILAVTNYLDAAPSFACGFLLNLYGMYGIEVVDLARSSQSPGAVAFADLLWSIGPHLHFADFTSRLTFFWGALPPMVFLNATLYFGGLLLFAGVLSVRLWKYRNA
ncbi:MAG: hypothetical protein JOZ08_25335 [Verrucomicrobia bacterium]|nr:hypothetical protein [Verrucomicrobiota bacterium]MBV8273700.1 hypothetical protein [Verrucomicrobiota bacterium]